MVLQRDKPIPIWGWGTPKSLVRVTFNGKTYRAGIKVDSSWSIKLPQMSAGGPYTMQVVQGAAKINLRNIMLGDVFICSGQSNMEFALLRAKDKYNSEIASATNPDIREFRVADSISYVPVKDVRSADGWKSADPQSVLKFTAVGYFFARKLYEKYHVAIGLIHSSWGGTPIESWMSPAALDSFPSYQQQAQQIRDHIKEIKNNEAMVAATWYAQALGIEKSFDRQEAFKGTSDTALWKSLSAPGVWPNPADTKNGGILWLKKEIVIPDGLEGQPARLFLGAIVEEDSTYLNGEKVGFTPDKYRERSYAVPPGLLKAGVNLVTVRIVSNYGPAAFTAGKTYQLKVQDQVFDLRGLLAGPMGGRISAAKCSSHYIPKSADRFV